MKKFLKLFLIVILFSVFTILIIYISRLNIMNKSNKDTINEENNIKIESVDIEETKEILYSENINKEIASINKEEFINQYDLNIQKLIDYNINKDKESYIEKTDDELLQECIKRKVTIHEANKNNINLSEDEINTLKNSYKNMYTNDDDIIAQSLKITSEEYINMLIDNEINNRIITKYHNKIIKKILNNELNIDSKEFSEKRKQFDVASDINKKAGILEELYEIYIEELISKSNIEIFNK